MSTINDTITLGALSTEDLRQMELDFDWPTMASGSITDTLSITSNSINTITTSTGGYTLTTGTGGSVGLGGGAPWITTTGGTGMWQDSITLGNIPSRTHTHQLEVKGDANFDGELRIKGVSLSERLDAIEERLNILRPNADLEERWEKLRGLGKMYRELEAEIIDKQKVWDALKA